MRGSSSGSAPKVRLYVNIVLKIGRLGASSGVGSELKSAGACTVMTELWARVVIASPAQNENTTVRGNSRRRKIELIRPVHLFADKLLVSSGTSE